MRSIPIMLLLALCACTAQPPPATPAAAETDRPETASIRATEQVGYAGDAVADKVDAALEQNAQRKNALDARIEADSESPDDAQ